MALPKAYLTSTRNLAGILAAIQTAQAPPKFTQSFLSDLEFKSSSDRLSINVLKALGFLTEDGTPTDRYYRFLDQTQAGHVMAEALRDAYSDLFQLDRKANEMDRTQVKNRMKTLARGAYSDAVLNKMAMTFEALVKHADFKSAPVAEADQDADEDPPDEDKEEGDDDQDERDGRKGRRSDERDRRESRVELGGLVYNIQLQLPESRDEAVYDALFRSLKQHLL